MNKVRLKEIYSQYFAGEFSPKESEVSDLFGMIDELEKQLGAEQRRLHEQDTQVAMLRETLEAIFDYARSGMEMAIPKIIGVVAEALAEEKEPALPVVTVNWDKWNLAHETERAERFESTLNYIYKITTETLVREAVVEALAEETPCQHENRKSEWYYDGKGKGHPQHVCMTCGQAEETPALREPKGAYWCARCQEYVLENHACAKSKKES